MLCAAPAAHGVDSGVCGTCHRSIYENYRRTPMAHSSGVVDAAAEHFENAAFDAGGFRFKVSPQSRRAVLGVREAGCHAARE
jgi:hypothetical protein